MKSLSPALLLSCLCLSLPAAAETPTFDESRSVALLEIPVTVTHGGKTLRGLDRDSFSVVAGGQKRDVVGFEVLDRRELSRGDSGGMKPFPTAAKRHVLFLFDFIAPYPDSVERARLGAIEVLDRLHESDMVAVATLGQSGSFFRLGFTSDRRQLRLALDGLSIDNRLDRPADPLGIVYKDPRLLASSGAADIPKNELDKLRARAVAPLDRASESGLSRAYTDSLEQIAEMLSVLPGRKDVVLFSEGAGIRTALLTGSDADSMQRRRSAEHGEIWSVASDDIYGWTHLQNRVEDAVEKLRRSGAIVHVLYTISPVGAADIRPRGEGPWAPTILLTLAHDTGGDLYENRYDLGEAIGTILERTEVTYLLTVQLDAVEHDGAFRKIQVKLAGAPRGARVAYRKGYFNPRPFAEIEPAARQLQTAAMILGTQEGGDLGIEVWAAALAGSESLALVPYLVEIDGPSLLAASDGAGNLPLEIVVYALGPTGRVEAFLRQTIGIDLERSRNQLEKGGIKYWGHLSLPPGEYSSRVLVRNTRNGMGTLRTIPVHVPADLNASFLAPAEIPDSVGRWAVIFEPEYRRSEMPYPFQIGERSIVPAAFPLVPSTGTTEVYWRGVEPNAQKDFSARLVDADGRSIESAKIIVDPPAEGSVGLVSARLETRDLAPGDYFLIGSLGEEVAESTLPIQVR